ncbi:hypothetical protein RHOFW104T7_17815 [Rhodanobacter thiooxydans]|uniref:Lipid A phosphate methyltransferase n=3 Tax=Rhodanobacter TaxID=75309 RepID=A0A154QEM0_9GAMM|nr:hypothetical protein RHOFW104T7_17815 [Rhodanobacter thiooxydans]
MPLRERIEQQGYWLFRWRSYLPLLLLPLFAFALRSYGQLEHAFGWLAGMGWELGCIALSFVGLLLRALTVGFVPAGTSGRNTSKQRADALNTTGIYSLVRHPLYLANFIGVLGVLLFTESLWLTLTVTLIYWVYYERIMLAEEAFLREKYGEPYLRWAAATPALVPHFGNYQPAAMPFSFRTVLQREYPSFFATVAAFTLIEWVGDWLGRHVFDHNPGWTAFFLAGFVIWLALRTLKKRRCLDVLGRQ